MRAVIKAVLNLAPRPDGFTAGDLAARTGALLRQSTYTSRHAAYDLRKLRGKERIGRVGRPGECRPTQAGSSAERAACLDVHHDNLQREMPRTFRALGLAA